jgi:hypothetical protein
MQLVLIAKIQQFVVRDAAPQEEREARREFQIADAIGRGPGWNGRRLALEAEDESGSMRTRAKACSMPASKSASRRPDR